MKVLLLRSIPKVGVKDSIVEVNEGFARNALFPKKIAIPATDAVVAGLARSQQNKQATKEIQHRLLDKALEALGNRTIVYKTKANTEGILFSKLHEKDIAKLFDEKYHIAVDPSNIVFPELIKKIGSYEVALKDGDYQVTCTLNVVV